MPDLPDGKKLAGATNPRNFSSKFHATPAYWLVVRKSSNHTPAIHVENA